MTTQNPPKKMKTWHYAAIAGALIVFFLVGKFSSKEVSTAAAPIMSQQQSDSIDRAKTIQRAFDPFNGSHRNLVKAVKEVMNNPKSFEHVDTKHWIRHNDTVIVKMTYRGTNAFGSTVTELVSATALLDGTLLDFKAE